VLSLAFIERVSLLSSLEAELPAGAPHGADAFGPGLLGSAEKAALSVERVFAVLKRVFGSGRVLVTSLERVRVKMVFSCLCFNLVQLGSLGAVS
jgi:hypothetical protein